MDYFMGIDTGTFESKGVLVDQNFKVIAVSAHPHGMDNPKPNHFEHDAEAVWWHDFCVISRDLLAQSGIDPKDIKALGASALGADCLPVDEQCRPLRKAILYGIDARAVDEMEQLTELYGQEQIKAWYGRPLCSSDVMPKILWIKNKEPEVYEKTHKFLTGSSYLTAKLTGRYTVDRFLGLSSFNPLYRPDGTPDEELCKPICRPDQLAEVLSTIDVAGRITPEAADETGLAEGTPVIVGTDDSGAEAISAGVLEPGDMMLQIGSSVYMFLCTDRLVSDDRVWREEFIIPGTFDISAGTNTAGTLTRWYRDQLFPDVTQVADKTGKNAYELMMHGIADIPPGSGGLVTLPYFAGERTPINDPMAKGVIFGLTLEHTRAHLYRSALESVGFAINQHFRIFREHRVPVRKIMATGGGTKNPLWLQMIADITGEIIRTPENTIGASFGDAMMAAMGIHYFSSYGDLAAVVEEGASYAPDPEKHRIYQKYQSVFDELYPKTKDLAHRL
ncbi:MAG: FGGY-family carbohydrate kinase [Eubacteriales bacterium]|jgi:xylulokinase|nr:FGGY-family carbohydrate kinase [Eubacteriales bacterium]MDD3290169.1 FGGY-family carbohydrate kinase [Eubacteriales bacterium]MDD3863341.1 FGGY-family carbohydrate kinase [Eubacteriales bacterium]MDD4444532.1 FGGY-family carbohydrate kinase [Eubacteriales bacterium]